MRRCPLVDADYMDHVPLEKLTVLSLFQCYSQILSLIKKRSLLSLHNLATWSPRSSDPSIGPSEILRVDGISWQRFHRRNQRATEKVRDQRGTSPAYFTAATDLEN